MRVHLNLSIIASLVAASIGIQQVAYAQVKDVDVVGSQKSGVQVYVNTQQRSLYQIALLSGISVSELRQLNKGILDKTDIVKVGERIILPSSSPLFSAEKGAKLPSLAQNKAEQGDVQGLDYQVASTLQTLGQQDWQNMSAGQLKNDAKTRIRGETEGYLRNQVSSNVVAPIESAAQSLLSRFGTAEVKISASDRFEFRGSSLKLFSPWYDSTNTLIFSQTSIQEYDSRWIGNFGLGQRWDINPQWLLGYNVFIDHDFDRAHNRLGAGLELWTDYLKFAANYYHPLSDWKDSKDFNDYLERAAKGFDLKVQGYIPSYPQIGASLMYEQYFGDEVALFGKTQLKKDPKAITVGLDYTPVPLVTIHGEHKQGGSSNTLAKVDLNLTYRIGVPLKDQLDPDKVAATRSLKGSRYDFVDRNNNIILEYKDQRLSIDLASFASSFQEGEVRGLSASVKAKNAIKDISFKGTLAELPNATDYIFQMTRGDISNYSNWQVKAPPFIDANGNRVPKYTLAMIVKDSSGKTRESNFIDILVDSTERKPMLNSGSYTDDGIITLDASLVDSAGNLFNDNEVYGNYPTCSTASDCAGKLDQIKPYWTIKDSSGDEIAIKAQCDASDAKCATVESVTKTTDSEGKHHYNIVVKYPNGSGSINVAMNVDPYGSSESVTVLKDDDGSGRVKLLKLYINDTFVGNSLSGKWDIPAEDEQELLTVNNKFKVEAFSDIAGNNAIEDAEYSWSLYGKNTKACSGSETDLGEALSDTPFIVSETDSYAIPANAESLTLTKSINDVTPDTPSCAGDQGFSLAISAK